jgi:hypothetical protein
MRVVEKAHERNRQDGLATVGEPPREEKTHGGLDSRRSLNHFFGKTDIRRE